jgi:hypothetical protein
MWRAGLIRCITTGWSRRVIVISVLGGSIFVCTALWIWSLRHVDSIALYRSTDALSVDSWSGRLTVAWMESQRKSERNEHWQLRHFREFAIADYREPRQNSLWNELGFTFRQMKFGYGDPPRVIVTAIGIPYWLLDGALVSVQIMLCVRLWKKWNQDKGRCTICGYDLRASGTICPECGAPIIRDD